jgi:hypothetical protein
MNTQKVEVNDTLLYRFKLTLTPGLLLSTLIDSEVLEALLNLPKTWKLLCPAIEDLMPVLDVLTIKLSKHAEFAICTDI